MNSAYSFDGVNDWIELPTSEKILGANPDEWSINAWFYTLDFPDPSNLTIISDQETPDNIYGIYIHQWDDPGSNPIIAAANSPTPPN